MLYYSKNSKSKIVHFASCRHSKSMLLENLGSFETLREAQEAGYRLCKHCNPVFPFYRSTRVQTQDYCRQNGIACEIYWQYVRLWTPHSSWRIVPTDNGEVALYHKNQWESYRDAQSSVKGFHLQNKRCKSLLDYCKYIVEHDQYRCACPAQKPNYAKLPKPPAPKGSKRWVKEQKREAKRERRRAIDNVFNLFAQLEAARA